MTFNLFRSAVRIGGYADANYAMQWSVMLLATVVIAAVVVTGAWWNGPVRQQGGAGPAGLSWSIEPEVRLIKRRLPDRQGLVPQEARKLNAAIPFGGDVAVAAQPFHIGAVDADRDRAVDCLAIAAMAEAGEGDRGQRAVIQVALNRVRHTSFPKTVCGVIFQGSHRSTGCQFTFTCDGALKRRHSPQAWSRARTMAIEALNGRVYSPVGLATHYHTDWVHPYWSASLIKLARIDTHLFFRWPGSAGHPAAFQAAYRGGEPAIAALAYLPSHARHHAGAALSSLISDPSPVTGSLDVVVRNEDGGAFVLLTGTPSEEGARKLAQSVCADRPSCKVLGWFDRASIPVGYPVPANSRSKLGFSYFRSLRDDETVLYNCSRFNSVRSGDCLPRT